MKREILFRGKLVDGNDWIYGDLAYYTDEKDQIRFHDEFEGTKYIIPQYVIPETVCQFTGMFDKNGCRIFEGDIVLQQTYNGKKKCIVEFNFGCFYAGFHNGSSTKKTPKLLQNYSEVIGNIHDNPELLNYQL